MKFLSQRDSLWASHKMGASDLTLGRYGCTTTCISMLSDYFGSYKTPIEIAANANNYTAVGLVLWSHLSFEKMAFEWREYGRNDARIQAALKDPDASVILQVNDGAHWVVAYSARVVKKGDYIIIDPWDGKKKSLLSEYKNITGAAYFRRKLNEEPVKPLPTPPEFKIRSRLIKGTGEEVFVFNGKKRFHIPDEETARLLFGADWTKEIEKVGNTDLELIKKGDSIPSLKLI